ncbi:GTP-binding protein [bacterium]|nr:GTP-binding protein [bacterium]
MSKHPITTSHKIPILAVTGFLGSGKTTFVNHLLREPHGLKIGVVVNDFGSINIDAELVAGKTDKQLELSNGCICCSLETLDLQEAIAQFAYVGSDIDLIVIEASGLAEPRDLALNLRDMKGIGVRLDAIITVIDAEHVIENAKEHANAADQLEFTDFIIINKTDLVDEARIDEIKQLIDMTNPRARVFETVKADVDIRLLTDPDRVWGSAEPHSHDDHGHNHDHHKHLHEKFTHLSIELSEPIHPMKFQEFVNNKIPKGVYRAKGFINLGSKGHNRKYIFQLVGTRSELYWDNWNKEGKPGTRIVFIGSDFDKKQLETDLRACIDPEPDAPLEGIELRLPQKWEG